MTVEARWTAERVTARVARSQIAAAALRSRVDGWFAERRCDDRFARFGTHFDSLHEVLRRMVGRIDTVLARLRDRVERAEPGLGYPDAGVMYRLCTDVDKAMTVVGRLFVWYALKYDQRLDEALADVLLAADEVVRSCWSEPFDAARVPRPTGPLVFFDPRFDAAATPRTSVPPDLRAPDDVLVGEFVAQLAIPVVALPVVAVAEPWWLVLAAHETGHHVQLDLSPRLVAGTRAALLAAAGEPPGDAQLATWWAGWAWEAFADAFAALAVGPAAAWAVEELQQATPADLVRSPRPGDRYPPPAVRTALLGELARCVEAPDPGPGAPEVRAWLDELPDGAVSGVAAKTVRALLAVTPRVAAALVDLRVDGVGLRRLCGWRPGFAASVAAWARQLAQPQPVITGRTDRAAARVGVAAAVLAYRQASEAPPQPPQPETAQTALQDLAKNVPSVLRACGPPGTLAGVPAVDVGALAERLADRLLPNPDKPAG